MLATTYFNNESVIVTVMTITKAAVIVIAKIIIHTKGACLRQAPFIF